MNTKPIHLYCIGAALIDMKFSLSLQDLEKTGLTQNERTLREHPEQLHLLETLSRFSKPHTDLGGSAFNTALAAQQFGARVFYTGKLGEDSIGKTFVEHLDAWHISSNAKKVLSTSPTGTCVSLVLPDGSRTMSTHLGANHSLSLEDIDEAVLKQSESIFLEGYLLDPKHKPGLMRDIILKAKHNGCKVVLSLSDPCVPKYFSKALKEVLDLKLDVLLCNEEEAFQLSHEQNLDEAIQQLQTFCPQGVVTLGARGARGWQHADVFEVQAPRIVPIDTTGAGDAFAGAYLAKRALGFPSQQAASLACSAASLLVSKDQMHLTPADLTLLQRPAT